MAKLLAWTLAALSLLATTASAQTQTPVRGGTLNFAVVAEPPNYDCHSNVTFGVTHPVAPHYSTLLKFHGATYPEVSGDLAQSWTVSPDGLAYTFKLHPNVKFHDGTALTSADVKASYERIIRPTGGIVSARQAYYADFGAIDTPDPLTVVFKLKNPVAGVLQLLASPFNCIYSAAKLAQNPRYPETEIMGTGAFTFVEHQRGSSWTAKRFDQYFKAGLPYLDGYKAYFVKSPNVLPGLLGGQFDAEFRFRSPSERDQLVEKMGDKVFVKEQPLVSALVVIFNTKKKPFDDQRVRQALSLAIDRWTAGEQLGKISAIKYVGGGVRPGYEMALPEIRARQAAGLWQGCGCGAGRGAEAPEGGRHRQAVDQADQPLRHRPLHDGRRLRHRPVAPHRRHRHARAIGDDALPGGTDRRQLRGRDRVHLRLHG